MSLWDSLFRSIPDYDDILDKINDLKKMAPSNSFVQEKLIPALKSYGAKMFAVSESIKRLRDMKDFLKDEMNRYEDIMDDLPTGDDFYRVAKKNYENLKKMYQEVSKQEEFYFGVYKKLAKRFEDLYEAVKEGIKDKDIVNNPVLIKFIKTYEAQARGIKSL